MVQQLAGGAPAPSLLVQRGRSAVPDLRSSQWGAGEVVEYWDCALAAPSGAVYLVGGGGEEGDPVLGTCLYAHQVARVPPRPGACAVPGWIPPSHCQYAA